jgi:hypothetical protein
MRRRVPRWAVVAVLAALGLLGGWPRGTPGHARADLRFPQTTFEAGAVRGGAVLTPRFTFTNAGTEPVEITEVRPGCGCLKPRLTQRTVRPGETGHLDLEVDTRRESAGPHVWQLDVRWGQGGTAGAATLRVVGHVVTEVTVQPAALTLLADEPEAPAVVVTDLRPTPLAVRAVTTTSPHVHAVCDAPQQSPLGHHSWSVRLAVDASCPTGRHAEVLTVHTTDAEHPTLEVPLTVVKRARPRLEAEPKSVAVAVPAGRTVQRTVTVRDRQGQPVVVEEVSADHEAITGAASAGPQGEGVVTIRVDGARLPPGGFSGVVRVRLSAPVRETVILPVDCLAD